MILIIYNKEIYKEYMLPKETSSDYTLRLDCQSFGLSKEVELLFKGTQQGFVLTADERYTLEQNRKGESCLLADGDIINVLTAGGDRFQIIVTGSQATLPVMEKYDLSVEPYISIGKDENNTIAYQFQNLVSANHCVLEQRADAFYIRDMSTNGIFYKNRRIHAERKLQFGDCIDIFGLHIVYLGTVLAVGTAYGQMKVNSTYMHPAAPVFAELSETNTTIIHAGHSRYFNRSPRNLPELAAETVEIDPPPTQNRTKEKPLFLTIGPSFTMAIPMLLGCSMAILSTRASGGSASAFMFTGVITAVSSAILGVFWALTNLRYAKQEQKEEEEERFNAYGNYLIKIADHVKMMYEQNKNALYQMYPSAEECCGYADTPRLWSRNLRHEDFLFVRLGLGSIPFQVQIEAPKEKFSMVNDSLQEKPQMIRQEYQTLQNVPVGIDLQKHTLIGLVGGAGKRGAIRLMQLIALQVAANTCYTDVKMMFVYDRATTISVQEWNCMKWFPHVWSEDRSVRLIAGDETEIGDVFFELTNVLRKRAEQMEGYAKKERIKPYYLLFIEDAAVLEGELIRKYIFEPREEYGLITFLMAESFEQLPNECEDIIQYDKYFCGVSSMQNEAQSSEQTVQGMNRPMQFDKVTWRQIEQFGRRICGLRVQELESHADIPASLDFLEMYQVHALQELEIEDRWRKNRTYNSMKALVGKKLGNADCYLDIHEKYHGPHGLIAGTTGSGKSETLQTYMLSLAINFSPDDLAFFVIDFKGGGMANLFSKLPHMAGQISNLSGNQVRRAMISIKSENMRRQRIFSEYGVNNINLYTRLYKNHETNIPMPHLLIIIDEFAELKREEPDFMRELISVAQVGRSLGVHLILATQKPAGTVDDSIWSNSKFRLCLRVQDRQDSNDMLHKPDAAFLTQAGRCYLQVGNDELYELFQSGYSGAPYYENEEGGEETCATMLTLTGKAAVVAGKKRRDAKKNAAKVKEQTQLDAIVDYLGEIAVQSGYDYRMQLWMPVLGNRILLSALAGYEEGLFDGTMYPNKSGKWKLCAAVGLYDDPENQAQRPLVIDFSENGHYAVCGTVVSGKSTFLQTVLFSLLMHYSPQYLNVYALDFSSKLLAPFEAAPHVGGVLYENDEEKVGKLFHLLHAMTEERKKLFHGGNYSQYVQVHGVTIPAVLVVIDNFAGFKEKTDNQYEEDLIRLSREGVGYGIYLLISSAGFGVSEISNRIAENMRAVVALEMGDKFHYMDVLRTSHIPLLPEAEVKGRGLAYVDGNILEFQTALALEAEDDFTRSKRINECCEQLARAWKEKTARPIPCIPEKPTLGVFLKEEGYRQELAAGARLPFAYVLEDASVYSVLLQHTYCYGIYGRKRTGKTNALRILMYAAAAVKDGELCVIEPEQTELEQTAKECGARYMTTPKDLFTYFSELTPVFVERNKKKQVLQKQGMTEEEIFVQMQQFSPVFIVIADLGQFVHLVYKRHDTVAPMNGFVENIMEKGSLHNIYFIAAHNIEESSSLTAYKAYSSFVNYKTGVMLGGNLASQRIFSFQNIPYAELTKSAKKGLGYVPDWEDEAVGRKLIVPLAVK